MKRDFLGASEMHARIDAHDWAATPMGPIETWPQSLRATIKTMLGSRYPMILLWGPELVQIYNAAYIGLIGEKHPGALGRSIRETQAESWEVIGPMIHEVMSTGVPNWVPAQMLPLERAGYREESYFSLSYSAVDDDEGRIAGMLCVCSEVTQQVLGERRTRLLRDLAIKAGATGKVETTCRGIAGAVAAHRLDVPFALLYVRGQEPSMLALEGTVGVEAGSPASPSAVDLRSGDGGGWPLARAAAGETILLHDVETRLAVSGGPFGDRVRSALVLPIASAEPGVPLGVFVAGLSPNRALDDGYRAFYELLSGQVSVALRNARAHEDERRRAEALAEIDRAKTQFFGNVSHEFRTPLTLMLGPLEDMLGRGEIPDAIRSELGMVHRNAGRLLRLVNALLDFSRLEAGRVEATYEPVDLAALTIDLASSFRSAAERGGLSLKVDCAPLSEPVYVDREMWEKIVLNLVSNAFKFTFHGNIAVTLREKDGRASLAVTDTGEGIPATALPHVFERFHRVRGAKGRTHEGTGIGLALVKELVKLHGGEVTVESTEGKGSTFTVTVPLGSSHLPKERVGAPGMNPGKTTTSAFVDEALRWLPSDATPALAAGRAADSDVARDRSGVAARILVADDNADMRDYLVHVLAPSFEVITVQDGQAALERVQNDGPFDLALTDVMMPRLGGFGLLQALRSHPRTRAMPVIMLSARAGEEASVEGLEAGADDYLVKPFSARELVARVRSALELSRMRRQIAIHEARAASLQESVRARDEFLSIASHELRTPLTPLQLHLDAIRRSAEAEGRELSAETLVPKLETMARQVVRLDRLVNTLIDIARILGRRLDVDCEDVDLTEVVRNVAGRFERELTHGECVLQLDLPERVVGYWDKMRIEQVVSHLVSNATKFGAGKPVEIEVKVEAGWARLAVRDHGIGIAREDQDRIFDRFERAVSASHYGGFGLGLWVVRQVVEALGGKVEVESQIGHGSLFAVRLPVRRPSTPPLGSSGTIH